MFNFFKKETILGIDISDHSLEILQLNKNKEVLANGRIILEEGIIEDGKIIKKEEFIKIIKKLLDSRPENIKSPEKLEAILSLPESRVFVRCFEFPANMDDDEIKESILQETEKIIEVSKEQIYWDYLSEKDKESQHVLYVGVLKEVVDEYVKIMNLAGIEPIVFEIESLSPSRAILKQTFLKSASMIADIGARSTILSVFDNKGVLMLSVIIPTAGKHFTKIIADKLKLDIEKAEEIKKDFGFDDKKVGNNIINILEDASKNIVKEIKKTISYYEENFGSKIEEIILAGGSALLPKIDAYLEKNTGKKVRIGNPLNKIKIKENLIRRKHPILFANVVGLAIRGTEKTEEGINLLPKSKKSPSKKSIFLPIKMPKLKYTIIAVFLITAFLTLGFIVNKYTFVENSTEKNQGPVIAPETEENNEPKIKTEMIVITDTPTGWLNVRNGPGTSFEKIARVNPGESYPLLEEKDDWYRIKIDDEREGWVISDYAQKE